MIKRMSRKNVKRFGALSVAILLMLAFSACQQTNEDQEWWDEKPEYAEVDLSVTDAPTEDPAKQLTVFMGDWQIGESVYTLELTEDNAVRFIDHKAEKSVACNYEINAGAKKLTLRQIDWEASDVRLKSGGKVCILEEDGRMRMTTLDGTDAMLMSRVGE